MAGGHTPSVVAVSDTEASSDVLPVSGHEQSKTVETSARLRALGRNTPLDTLPWRPLRTLSKENLLCTSTRTLPSLSKTNPASWSGHRDHHSLQEARKPPWLGNVHPSGHPVMARGQPALKCSFVSNGPFPYPFRSRHLASSIFSTSAPASELPDVWLHKAHCKSKICWTFIASLASFYLLRSICQTLYVS